MTASEFSIFLYGTTFLCAVMVLLNLGMAKKRGASAYIMAVSFLVAAGAILGVAKGGITTWTYIGGGVVVVLMIADFLLRSAKRV